jgi:hypothetical protein
VSGSTRRGVPCLVVDGGMTVPDWEVRRWALRRARDRRAPAGILRQCFGSTSLAVASVRVQRSTPAADATTVAGVSTKGMNRLRLHEEAKPAPPPRQEVLLEEIRDLLAKK